MYIVHLYPSAAAYAPLIRLIDFFKYFSREFSYGLGAASIRAGLLKKESKGWSTDVSLGATHPYSCTHHISLIQ
jgi:DNA polymerase sigma